MPSDALRVDARGDERSGQRVDARGDEQPEQRVDARGDEQPALRVLIEQDLCTGDGLCAQYAPEVFELDVDGLAYVKDSSGELLTAPGALADVPAKLVTDVIASAKECPGNCIHVVRASDGVEVAGPDA